MSFIISNHTEEILRVFSLLVVGSALAAAWKSSSWIVRGLLTPLAAVMFLGGALLNAVQVVEIYHSLTGGELGVSFQSETNSPPRERATIAQAQRALAAAGFDPGPADGIPGRRTRSAIRRYRSAKGLAPTDQIDSALLSHLGLSAASARPLSRIVIPDPGGGTEHFETIAESPDWIKMGRYLHLTPEGEIVSWDHPRATSVPMHHEHCVLGPTFNPTFHEVYFNNEWGRLAADAVCRAYNGSPFPGGGHRTGCDRRAERAAIHCETGADPVLRPEGVMAKERP